MLHRGHRVEADLDAPGRAAGLRRAGQDRVAHLVLYHCDDLGPSSHFSRCVA